MKVKLLNHEIVDLQESLDNMYDDEFYYKHLNLDRVLSYSYNEVASEEPEMV